MTSEASNYLRRCARPGFAAAAAGALLSRVVWSGVRRVWPDSRFLFQPPAVKRLRRELLARESIETNNATAAEAVHATLTLTAGSMIVDGDSAWFPLFADEEVTVSLHRWNWLLRGLTDDPIVLSRPDGLALMRSWIRSARSHPELERDAYSTGERIVNGSLFLLLTGDATIPPDIAAAFTRMSRQVAEHVEYYRGQQTGNHALNNARALLFAGLVSGAPLATNLAYAICEERLPELVTADGFLREGSSHYHLLFTRWVLEMAWVAERNANEAFARLLKPYAERLVRNCWFFLVRDRADGEWRIPLFGDVSPDFPPRWLTGLPWSSPACAVYRPDRFPERPRTRGWHSLFESVAGTGDADREYASPPSASGWCRIDAHAWTVFVRANSTNGALIAGHFHHDLGGIVVFHHGAPVVVDTGRIDYTLSPISLYGISAAAHSTVLVDDLGTVAEGPSWLNDRYRAVNASVDVDSDGDETVITLTHDGFTRLSGQVGRHRRRLRLGAGRLVVEDRLEGAGRHHVRLRFHLAPEIALRDRPDGGWTLGGTGVSFLPSDLPDAVVQRGQASPPFGGLFFPEYGCQQTSQTLDLSGSVMLPATFAHSLNLENS